MVIERMICLSNGSSTLPVELRQGDYNVEIRLLVYETPQQLMDMTGNVATVIYEKDGVPTDPYEAIVEEGSWLRFIFPATVAKENGNGLMQVAIYGEDSLLHSYMLPFVVERSVPSPVYGTSASPAPAFFTLIKEAQRVIDSANDVLDNPPKINSGNEWELWNPTGMGYEKTGKPSIPLLTFRAKTGEPGTDVIISQSGTPEKPVLEITIPRGEKGFVEGVDYSDDDPTELLLKASPGTKMSVARGDHAHPLPALDNLPGVLPVSAGGTGAVNEVEALERLGAASVAYVNEQVGAKASTAVFYSTLVASGWSSSAPYTQTAIASGILSTDVPFVDVDMSGTTGSEAGTTRQEAWSFVGRVTVSANGEITAYCYEEKPTVDIPLILKVVR